MPSTEGEDNPFTDLLDTQVEDFLNSTRGEPEDGWKPSNLIDPVLPFLSRLRRDFLEHQDEIVPGRKSRAAIVAAGATGAALWGVGSGAMAVLAGYMYWVYAKQRTKYPYKF